MQHPVANDAADVTVQVKSGATVADLTDMLDAHTEEVANVIPSSSAAAEKFTPRPLRTTKLTSHSVVSLRLLRPRRTRYISVGFYQRSTTRTVNDQRKRMKWYERHAKRNTPRSLTMISTLLTGTGLATRRRS